MTNRDIAAAKRRQATTDALAAGPLSADDVGIKLGISKEAAQSHLQRMREAGLVVALRFGLGSLWTLPNNVDEVQQALVARRRAKRKEANALKNYRYRARRAGVDPDSDDDGVVQRIVQSWRKPVKRGPASVWELAA